MSVNVKLALVHFNEGRLQRNIAEGCDHTASALAPAN